MAKKIQTKSAVFGHLESTTDGKHFVCQRTIQEPEGEKYCNTKTGAHSGTDKNAPIRASNFGKTQRHHPEIFQTVSET
jgi:hypothetical protein